MYLACISSCTVVGVQYMSRLRLLSVTTTTSEAPTAIPATSSPTPSARPSAKKARKATRRAEREGRGDPTAGQKPCDLCGKSVDLLVRCQYNGSSGEWRMVRGRCWNGTGGGVVDGDADHPEYRYGGLWKNRRRAQKQAR